MEKNMAKNKTMAEKWDGMSKEKKTAIKVIAIAAGVLIAGIFISYKLGKDSGCPQMDDLEGYKFMVLMDNDDSTKCAMSIFTADEISTETPAEIGAKVAEMITRTFGYTSEDPSEIKEVMEIGIF